MIATTIISSISVKPCCRKPDFLIATCPDSLEPRANLLDRAPIFSEAGPVPAEGYVAQRVFQYITWLSGPEFHEPGNPVVNDDGTLRWRVAPTPHGKYWDDVLLAVFRDWDVLQK